MKKKYKKNKNQSTGMPALADGNLGTFMQASLFDPNGSYTGRPFVGGLGEMDFEEPEQDVDDL